MKNQDPLRNWGGGEGEGGGLDCRIYTLTLVKAYGVRVEKSRPPEKFVGVRSSNFKPCHDSRRCHDFPKLIDFLS